MIHEWIILLAIVAIGGGVGYALARTAAPGSARAHKSISVSTTEEEGSGGSGDGPKSRRGRRHSRSRSDSAGSADASDEDESAQDADLALTLERMKTEHAAHVESFPSAPGDSTSPPLPADSHRRVFIVSKYLPLYISTVKAGDVQSTPAQTPMSSPHAEPVAATSEQTSSIDNFSLDSLSSPPRNNNLAQKRTSVSSAAPPSLAPRVPSSGVVEQDGIKFKVEWGDSRSFLANLRCLLTSAPAAPSLPQGFGPVGTAEQPEVKWLGMSSVSDVGLFATPAERAAYEATLARNLCSPVYLDPNVKLGYNQFCKTILWPLLHYITPNDSTDVAVRLAEYWEAYQTANACYADAIVAQMAGGSRSGDMIWIHNHELFGLPGAIRERLPRATIGLFVHTPFPSSDVFRSLPNRKEMLESLMACDLLGFQTFDYARHFLSCIKRVLDMDFETLPGGVLGVRHHGRFVSIHISHVGIESAVYREFAESESVKRRVDQLRAQHAGKKIIVGVDEADVAKTPLLKLQAFDRFLARHPEWTNKVVIFQVLTPTKNSDGTAIQRDLDAAIGELRRKYGDGIIEVITPAMLEAAPNAEVLDCGIPMRDLVRLYMAADVAIMTSFYEGGSIAPFECTASQGGSVPAVLIISEFMGCSRSLNGVLRVNPWSLEAISDALSSALQMGSEERRANHSRRHHYVTHHTATKWATGVLDAMARATRLGAELNYVHVGRGAAHKLLGLKSTFVHLPAELLVQTYSAADLRVILLDYDGTLVPADTAADLASCASNPPESVLQMLRLLSEQPNTAVFILSGRTRSVLTQWFGHLPELGIAAEKGLFLRWPASLAADCRFDQPSTELADQVQHEPDSSSSSSSTSSGSDSESESDERELEREQGGLLSSPSSVRACEWESLIPLDSDCSWKETALEIIRAYTEQTDGSWIEDKELAIVWHYESADAEYGRMQSSDLMRYLTRILANPKVDVLRYDKSRILEVKPHGVNKGLAATAILESLWLRSEKEAARAATFVSPVSLPSVPLSPRTLATSFRPFVLAMGDDRSDEVMFVDVQSKSYLDRRVRGRETHSYVDPRPSNSASLTAVPQTPSNAAHDPETSPTPISPTISGRTPHGAHSHPPSADPNLFTVCVGLKPSNAHYYVNDYQEALRSLYGLVLRDQEENAAAAAHKREEKQLGGLTKRR